MYAKQVENPKIVIKPQLINQHSSTVDQKASFSLCFWYTSILTIRMVFGPYSMHAIYDIIGIYSMYAIYDIIGIYSMHDIYDIIGIYGMHAIYSIHAIWSAHH